MDKQQFLDLVGLSVLTSELLNKTAAKIHTHTKSQITDFPTSMPASDVQSWAKAAVKPSYTPTEVGVIGTAPASGQVAVFDGTTGKIKSTGFTIATSVPSGAKFTDTIYAHPTYTARSSGLYKITVDGTGHVSAVTAVTKADITALGIPGQDTNTTYAVFKGATADAAGTVGLVAAPAKGQQGLYLRGDGTWATPTNTTYGLASATTNGLLSSADFTKIAKFTATEAGYLSGVTSAIQTQLNGKAPSSHGTHVTYGSKTTALVSGGTGTVGTSSALSREDHTHTLPAYPTALKNPTALTISLNGSSQGAYDGSAAKSINITPASIGAAAASHGTHVPSVCTTITDWNAATSNGWYMASGATNQPSGTSSTWFFGKVTAHNTNYLVQELYQFTASSDAYSVPKWLRFRTNGTWGDWRNVTIGTQVPTGAKFTDTIYSHPTSSGNKHIPSGGSSGQILRWSADGTAMWGADNNTTYSVGTASALGLTKLYTSTGTATDGTMTQAAIKTALDGKAASSHGTHVSYGTTTTALTSGGTGAVGTATTLSRSDHTHTLPAYPTALKSPGALTISLNSSSQGAYDGSSAKSINITAANIGAATSGHTHISLVSKTDDRGVKTKPDDYNGLFKIVGLKTNTVIGITNGDTYSGVLGMRGWSDKSGGEAHEFALTGNGKLFHRHGADTAWGTWYQIYTSEFKPTPSEIGAAASSHTHTKSQITDFPASLKNPTALTLQFNGTTNQTYDGSAAKTFNVTPAAIGALASGGTAVNASKVANSIIIKLNGGGTEGTNLFTFNGSAAKTINITAASIGAAAASHGTHVSYGTTTTALTSGGTGAVGSASTLARSDHTHTLPAYPTALKCPATLTINGTIYDGSTAKTVNISTAWASISAKPDLLNCMRMYGGTALDSKGTTADSNAQYNTIALSTATANASAFSKVLTDLPKGKYSVMIRMKMSAITSTANIIKIQCGDTSALKTFYVRPNMFTTANVYQTFGFTVEHTTTSFTANLTIGTALAGATVTVDYLAVAPTFTAISSVA